MNKLLIIITVFVISKGFAQQVPFYNHHFINPFVYNPAFTGYSGNTTAFLVRNSRNSSFDGGAINNYLTVDGSLKDGKYGLGLSIMNQTHGIQQQLGGGISYAYELMINPDNTIRFGVNAGFLDNQLDATAINAAHENDPYLLEINRNKLTYNGSVGLLYEWRNARLGIAVPQIIGNKVEYGGTNSRGFYQLERHFMLNGAYRFDLTSDKNWSLTPIVMLRYLPGMMMQYDGLIQVDNKKRFWAAVGYKLDYAVEVNLGVRLLNALHVGYSYEYVIGSMKTYQSGMNHEFLLGYTFGNSDKYKKKIGELEEQNAELELRRQELKRELEQKRQLQEQMSLNQNEVQLVDRNITLEDSIQRLDALNRMLEMQANQLREELNALKKELNRPVDDLTVENPVDKVEVSDDEKITRSAGYRFVDLQGVGAPSGYYVINGVFSSRSNAMSHLESTKNTGNENAYLLLNWTNKFYYVILFYTESDRAAINARKEYKKTSDIKTWILEYYKGD